MKERDFYRKVCKVTPWGTQTNAKRPKPIIEETMPYFVTKANGSRFVNTEGREYIDFFCSCGPIILGHAFKKVDDKVIEQIRKGFLYSVASATEYDLACKLIDLLPSLDWVKYLKTGNDATTAAVRIARAYTGKEKILQCGYHGWNDWYQAAKGGGRKQGIPDFNKQYTIPFKYNDIESVKKILLEDDNIAGIIMVPYDWRNEPKDNFLVEIRKLCDKYDIPLIFDEVLTGFRIGLKGAQDVFGVEPDITVFAKAISNGYPLSVVGGKKKYSYVLSDDKTLITTTYAGDALSIVAAINTIDVMIKNDVHSYIYKMGNMLIDGLNEIVNEYNYPIKVKGRAPLTTLFVEGENKKSLNKMWQISREYMKNGLFIKEHGGVTYYLNYSHTENDIERTLEVTRNIFKNLF